jgi:hypothetical protein
MTTPKKATGDDVLVGAIAFWSISRERAEKVANGHSPPWQVIETGGGFAVKSPDDAS